MNKRGSWALALIMMVSCFIPQIAYADDILLGMFFTSDSDYMNSIYASYDGTSMRRIATTFDTEGRDSNGTSIYYDGQGNTHYGQVDPSIVYYNDKFWCLSNWNRNDGLFWPIISYSTDLIHWTHPEGDALLTGTRGIALDEYPSGAGTSFDVVAPEWFVSSNGSLYIVFSAGYYGAFHGEPTVDHMQAYIVKVEELSAGAGTQDESTKYLYPHDLTFNAGTAYRLNLPGNTDEDANYIDGALYSDGNIDYLAIKKDGLTIQIYSTTSIDSNSWSPVNSNAIENYEGPSIARLGVTYYLAADHITGAGADGVKLFTASSLDDRWSMANTQFLDDNGNSCPARHGSLLSLPEGTDGWRIAKALLDAAITNSDTNTNTDTTAAAQPTDASSTKPADTSTTATDTGVAKSNSGVANSNYVIYNDDTAAATATTARVAQNTVSTSARTSSAGTPNTYDSSDFGLAIFAATLGISSIIGATRLR